MDKAYTLQQLLEIDFESPVNVSITFEDDEETEQKPDLKTLEQIHDTNPINANIDKPETKKCAEDQKPSKLGKRDILELNTVDNKAKEQEDASQQMKNGKVKIGSAQKRKLDENSNSEEPIVKSFYFNSTEYVSSGLDISTAMTDVSSKATYFATNRRLVSEPYEGNSMSNPIAVTSSIRDSSKKLTSPEKNVVETESSTFIEKLLDTVSENIVHIVSVLYQTQRVEQEFIKKRATKDELERSRMNMMSAKDIFFKLSYSTIASIFLPHEENIMLINGFLTNTMNIAKSRSVNVSKSLLEKVYKDMIEWAKFKRNELSQLSISNNTNRNLIEMLQTPNDVSNANISSNPVNNINDTKCTETYAPTTKVLGTYVSAPNKGIISKGLTRPLTNTLYGQKTLFSSDMKLKQKLSQPQPMQRQQMQQSNISAMYYAQQNCSSAPINHTNSTHRFGNLETNKTINNITAQIPSTSQQKTNATIGSLPGSQQTFPFLQQNPYLQQLSVINYKFLEPATYLQPNQTNCANFIQKNQQQTVDQYQTQDYQRRPFPPPPYRAPAERSNKNLPNYVNNNLTYQIPVINRGQGNQDQKLQQLETTRSLSTDSGINSPLNFVNTEEMNNQEQPESDDTCTPLITHVTSLHPNATYLQEHSCHVCKSLTRTRCRGCFQVYYCSHECQKFDWQVHMNICQQPDNNMFYM